MNQTNSTAMAVKDVQSEQPHGEVRQEFAQSRKNLETLRMAIDSLNARLRPVLAERRDAEAAEVSAPEPVRVELAQTIYDYNCDFAAQLDRLNSIINRIEV